jgi:DNA primase
VTLDRPGITILVKLLETLAQNPHLTTAMLLERARGSEHEGHLQQLVKQPLTLGAEELQHELKGIIQQLQQQAVEQRHAYLVTKGLRNLTAEERIEIQQLK